MRRLCFWLFYTINIYGYSLYIPYIYIFHVYFLAMWSMFSLVCFLIHEVKSRSGHDRSQSFGSISHISGPKLTFWGNFIMVLHGFVSRSPRNIVFFCFDNKQYFCYKIYNHLQSLNLLIKTMERCNFWKRFSAGLQ